MNDNLKAVLEERLHKNYEDFMAQLQGKTPSELIALAPEITAAQQLHEELLNACNDSDVAFLLQFDDPLEVVRGYWADEITGCDYSDEIGHMLWEIQDRELYSKEQLAPVKPSMELVGQDGNIFGILGRASRLLKQVGQDEQAKEMFSRVTSCGDYYEALNIISEYVNTELSDHSQHQKSHTKKGKDAYER